MATGSMPDHVKMVNEFLAGLANPRPDTQPVVAAEVLVILEVQGSERHVMCHAAGSDPHVVYWTGATRVAAADRIAQVAATASSPGSTAAGQAMRPARRGDLAQLRISAHLASSPKVTKVISTSRPISRAASGPASVVPLQPRGHVGVQDRRIQGHPQARSR